MIFIHLKCSNYTTLVILALIVMFCFPKQNVTITGHFLFLDVQHTKPNL